MTQSEQSTEQPEPDADGRHVNGKVSYIEIPAIDAQQSARFYEKVFNWNVRGDPEHPHFDATGDLIGAWVAGRTISREPGIILYIYVERFDETLELALANGAEVVRPPWPEEELWVATFRDPAGNVIGIYHRGPR